MVSWATQNAQSVNFLVDGSAGNDPGNEPNGSGNPGPIACNGQPHTVSIDAFGANNRSVTKSATVNPG